jgi:hypothetical protein
MSSSTDPRRAEAPVATDQKAPDGEAIRHEIERVREDLGDTISALSEKADVKAQASAKAAPAIAATVTLVIVVWMVLWARRRHA